MEETPAKKPKSGWINVVVDYGPLLVFFLTYRIYRPEGEDTAGEILAVIRSTGAFIVAALIALAAGQGLADAMAFHGTHRRLRRADDVHG